jgi:protein SCO1/2
MRKKLLFQLAGGLLIIMSLAVVYTTLLNKPYQFQGSIIDPPVPATDFVLKSGDGTQFQLSTYRGKVVLLYFGYTFCPDVCPTTLYDLAQVKTKLGVKSKDIIVAMITVDPERDTLEKLGEYATTFDSSFFGLRGDIKTLKAVWADYGVFRQKNEVESSARYLIDHTARVYVIDREGNLRMTFPFGIDWEAIADDLAYLLSE